VDVVFLPAAVWGTEQTTKQEEQRTRTANKEQEQQTKNKNNKQRTRTTKQKNKSDKKGTRTTNKEQEQQTKPETNTNKQAEKMRGQEKTRPKNNMWHVEKRICTGASSFGKAYCSLAILPRKNEIHRAKIIFSGGKMKFRKQNSFFPGKK